MKQKIPRSGLLLIVMASIVTTLSAEIPASNKTSISIQLFDQQLYYEGDPIKIKVTLSNDSPEIYRFRLADTRMFSLDFAVKTLGNQDTRPSQTFVSVISQNKPIYVRDVLLQPGEDFSFIETLTDYKDLNSGVFVVAANFYPELKGSMQSFPLLSNRLTVSIRPAVRKAAQAEETLLVKVEEILRAEKLPPDQVVDYMLQARQRTEQKERFFLYLDLKSLYNNDGRRGERFKRMSELDQETELLKYKEELWAGTPNDTISFIPKSWNIVETNYRGNNGRVIVLQRYQSPGSSVIEVKEYRYNLTLQSGIWKIRDYVVNNKGTE